ncbi:MAG: hypothetical protein AAF629_28720 [Chloroflexota bacterium]
MSKNNQALPEDGVGNIQEIERVRQIIFGPQIRKYDQLFHEAQADLARLQQEIDRLNEQLSSQRTDHEKKLQELRREVRQSDDNIRSELRKTSEQLTTDKVDRVALGELFVTLGTHLRTGGELTTLTAGPLADLIGQLKEK